MSQHVPSLFRSFWMAGFESSLHINKYGVRLDMIAATQHDRFIDEDYARLLEFDLRTAVFHTGERDLVPCVGGRRRRLVPSSRQRPRARAQTAADSDRDRLD